MRNKPAAFWLHALLVVCLALSSVLVGCASKKQTSASVLGDLKDPQPHELNSDAYHHYTNGVIYEEEGMFNDAAREYEMALSYEPLSYDIRTALGSLYLNTSQAAKAIDALLPITPKDVDVYRMLGDGFRMTGKDTEAEESYLLAWHLDPKDVNVNYYLGVYASMHQRVDEAAKYFRYAAQASMNYQLYTQIAEMYSSMQQYDSAAVFMGEAIKLNQSDPFLFSQHAVYLYSAGKKAESKDVLQRGITLHPQNSRLLAQLAETYNAEDNTDSLRYYTGRMLALDSLTNDDKVIFERIGSVMMRAEQNDIARQIFEKTLTIDPKNRVSLFYLGRIEIDSSHYAAARPYFRRLIAADSSVADGWTNLAFSYQQEKKIDSAKVVLAEAVKHVRIDRDNVQLYYAQMLSQQNESDSSISVLRNVILEGGDTIRALFQIGAEYEKKKNFEKAAESFELLLSIQPNHAQALNYYGYMLADRGERLDEAFKMIEAALKSDPENGAYLDSYAWVLFKMGRNDEALVQIQKAIKATNNDPVVIEHLGDIQFALGNVESAKDAWKTALVYDPANKGLQEKLKR